MEESIYRVLARRLREERHAAGLTQERLGERAGITGAFVAHIEAGRKQAALATVQRLARALDLRPSMLLEAPKALGPDPAARHMADVSRLLRGRTDGERTKLLAVLRAASALLRP